MIRYILILVYFTECTKFILYNIFIRSSLKDPFFILLVLRYFVLMIDVTATMWISLTVMRFEITAMKYAHCTCLS